MMWLKPDLDAHHKYRQFWLFPSQFAFWLPAFLFFCPLGLWARTLAGLAVKIFRGPNIATDCDVAGFYASFALS